MATRPMGIGRGPGPCTSSAMEITDLLHMTPYWWRASAEQRAAIGDLAGLTTTVDHG